MASFYNNYYRYYRPYHSPHFNHPTNTSLSPSQQDKSHQENDHHLSKEEKSSRSFGPIHFKNLLFNDIEEPIFEILGIQLYLDDIIILVLLFFLYQEGVQDEMLFISLILLLIT